MRQAKAEPCAHLRRRSGYTFALAGRRAWSLLPAAPGGYTFALAGRRAWSLLPAGPAAMRQAELLMAAEGASVYGGAPRGPQLSLLRKLRRAGVDLDADYVDETRSSVRPGLLPGQPPAAVDLLSQPSA